VAAGEHGAGEEDVVGEGAVDEGDVGKLAALTRDWKVVTGADSLAPAVLAGPTAAQAPAPVYIAVDGSLLLTLAEPARKVAHHVQIVARRRARTVREQGTAQDDGPAAVQAPTPRQGQIEPLIGHFVPHLFVVCCLFAVERLLSRFARVRLLATAETARTLSDSFSGCSRSAACAVSSDAGGNWNSGRCRLRGVLALMLLRERRERLNGSRE